MTSEWEAFVSSQASGSERLPARADCALMDLSHLGLIQVAGADAKDFLQGLLTNDVRELSESHAQLSSHCSTKGRMLANFRVFERDESIYLQSPRETLAATIERLSRFVLRSRVTIAEDQELVAIALAGGCAGDLVARHLGPAPTADNEIRRSGEALIIRMSGPIERYQLIAPMASIKPLWTALSGEARHVAGDYWRLLEIRAGIPVVLSNTADAFVPQMANMQLVDGVSFNKGCYVGQEVVARMQYLGKLKRRLYLGEVESPVAPQPGDDLVAEDGASSGQGTGRIVDAQPVDEGRYELLAVVEVSAAEESGVRLGSDGPRVSLREPPYGFESAAA